MEDGYGQSFLVHTFHPYMGITNEPFIERYFPGEKKNRKIDEQRDEKKTFQRKSGKKTK